MARGVVAELAAGLDAFVQARQRVHLQGQVEAQLFGNVLADVDLAQALHVGDAVQEKDPLDDLLGMLHLAHGLLADGVLQPAIAPVLAHFAVDEILVDGRELGGEDVVEDLDDAFFALHAGESITGTTAAFRGGGAAAVRRIISRSMSAQLPQSPPMPQRSSSERQEAPAWMAALTSRSEAARQLQTIIAIETKSQS